MRFRFVDKITSMTDTSIAGSCYFSPQEALQYAEQKLIAPGVISEAIGQLVSWLAIDKSAFQSRPVFLFAREIRIHQLVPADTEIQLAGEILAFEETSLLFSGVATQGGHVIQEIHECQCHLLPLGDLENVEEARARFAALQEGRVPRPSESETLFDFSSLIDDILTLDLDRSVVTKKSMRSNERFFMEHFPNYPVTPIVMVNEMIGEVTRRAIADKSIRLTPAVVNNIKIKSFLRPGETCEVSVTIDAFDRHAGVLKTTAEVRKEKKVILRGQYDYRAEVYP